MEFVEEDWDSMTSVNSEMQSARDTRYTPQSPHYNPDLNPPLPTAPPPKTPSHLEPPPAQGPAEFRGGSRHPGVSTYQASLGVPVYPNSPALSIPPRPAEVMGLPEYLGTSPGYLGTSPGYLGRSPGYLETSPGYLGRSPGYLETSPGYLDTSPGYLETSPGYLGTSPGYLGRSPGYLETSPGYLGTSPGYLETSPGYLGTSPGYSRTLTRSPGPPGYYDQPRQPEYLREEVVYVQASGVHARVSAHPSYTGPSNQPRLLHPQDVPVHPPCFQIHQESRQVHPVIIEPTSQDPIGMNIANPCHPQGFLNSRNPGMPPSSPRSDRFFQLSEHHQMSHAQTTVLWNANHSDMDAEFKPPTFRSENAIEVHGSDVSSSSMDKYRYFFENPRKGGGEVEDFQVTEDDILLISFKESSVACGLINKGTLEIGQTQVTIKQHISLPLYKKKVSLEYEGAHRDHSCTDLRNYLEARSGGAEVTSMEAGSKQDVLLLTFQQAVDTQRLQSACSQRLFNKKVISFREVPVTKILQIHGVPDSVTSDTVQNYFETAKSGNVTNREVIKVDELEGDGSYLLHFDDYRGIEKIVKVSHTLGKQQITVCLYHKCIGLTSAGRAHGRRTEPSESKQIRQSLPAAKGKLDLKKNEVSLEGLEDEITEVRQKMHHVSIAGETIEVQNISEQQIALLEKTSVRDEITSRLKENGIIADWVRKQSTVEVTSNSKSGAEEAMRLILSNVIERILFLENDMQLLLSSDSWESLNSELTKIFLGRFSITYVKDKNCLLIVALHDNIDIIYVEIKRFFAVETTVVDVSRGVFRFIQAHLSKEVEMIEKDLKSMHVQITFEDMQFAVQGCKEGIEKCTHRLDRVRSKVKHHKELMQKACLTKMLISAKGAEMVSHVERLERCTIEVGYDTKQIDSPRCTKRADPTSTVVATSNLPGGRKIYKDAQHTGPGVVIVIGQIAKETADVIVNSTNQKLQLEQAGAVSKSLAEEAGPSLQAACTDHYPQGIKAGSLAVTPGGNLQCKRVYHVFLPSFSSDQQARKDVRDVVLKCLTTDSTHTVSSMAFPALGTGGLKYPRDLVAETMFAAIEEYWTQNPGSSLKDVRIVLYAKDQETITAFNKQKGIHSPADQHQQRRRSSLSQRRGTDVVLVKGNIAKQKADVIVNSTNRKLQLTEAGAVSKSLAEEAGPEWVSACSRRYPNGIPPGFVAVTPGGNLQCKHVYHVFLPEYSTDQQARTDVRDVVLKCLTTDSTHTVSSMAFPALGTGGLKYPRDLVAETMFAAIQDYWTQNPGSSLKDVRIVLYAKDQETITAFEEKNGRYRLQQQLRRFHRKPDLVSGSITTFQGNVIVNPTNAELNLDRSRLSSSIAEAAGPKLVSQIKKKFPEGVPQSGLAVSKAGRLNAKEIYHVVVENWNRASGLQPISTAVTTCLEKAHQSKHTSILFPTLGIGYLGYDKAAVAQTMYDAIDAFWTSKPGTCVTQIKIVIYDDDVAKIFEQEKMAFYQIQDSRKGRQLKVSSKYPESEDAFLKLEGPPKRRHSHSNVSKCDVDIGLEVSFFSDTQEAIQAAKQKLQDVCGDEFTSTEKDIAALKSLDDVKIQLLRSEAKQHDVFIELYQPLGRIRLQGIKDDVSEMVERIYAICLEQKDDETTEILGSVVQWHYMEMGEEEQLVKYNPDTNKAIEKAFRENKECHVLEDVDGNRFVVDFGDMVEYREDDHGDRCPLIRKDLIKAAELDAPPSWEDMDPNENLKVLGVNPDSDEYARVSTKFASANKKIIKIERIQNKTLYKQYQAKKQLFEQRTSNTKPCERELWHGTASNAIHSINKDGFNRSYCGKNAVAYGNGVYFAVQPSYSAQDQYAQSDSNGNRYIYLLDVLTGEYKGGKQGMRVPPPVDPGVPSVLCDSVVANINNPIMFVIFNDTQAYPKYLITFKSDRN